MQNLKLWFWFDQRRNIEKPQCSVTVIRPDLSNFRGLSSSITPCRHQMMPLFNSQEKPGNRRKIDILETQKLTLTQKQNKTVQPTDLQLNPQSFWKQTSLLYLLCASRWGPQSLLFFVDLFIPIVNTHLQPMGFFIGVCWGSNYLKTAKRGDHSCWHLRTFVALLALLALLFAALQGWARLVSWLVGIRWGSKAWKTWFEK